MPQTRKAPEIQEFCSLLGMCHLNIGNLPQGKALFEQVLKLDPGNEDARQVLKQLTKP